VSATKPVEAIILIAVALITMMLFVFMVATGRQ
jgi:hypothetical protein